MNASPLSPAPIDHYENFPVASWLCPPRLRAPITAIYHFARTADDLADEGDVAADQRLSDLAAYRADLMSAVHGGEFSARWSHVFTPLARQIAAFELPTEPFVDLLSAFEQDVHKTRDQCGYATTAELLDYCRRSANPVGRLLLHLYGVKSAEALNESDAICTALQLINFWQDLSVDIPRGRYYLPLSECAAHGIPVDEPPRDFSALKHGEETARLIAACVAQAEALMRAGSPLVHRVPGRAGWELRAVIQGGLRILDKIKATGYATLETRPALGKADVPRVIWRMLQM